MTPETEYQYLLTGSPQKKVCEGVATSSHTFFCDVSLLSASNYEYQLKAGFKWLNRFMVLLWRLGLGNWLNIWPEVLGQYMVITHTGRKSGLHRRTPVNYALVDGEIYCTAGFGQTSDWYRNILANPAIEVWLPDGWWTGKAEDVSDDGKRLFLLRQVLIASGFAAPVFGVNPHKLTDQQLEALTRTYRLLRIVKTQARTGPDGPGDLAWIWPVATFLLLLGWMKKKR